METKEINLENLKPYKNNPRVHSKEQIIQIANSINELGFLNPILTDENNMILAGHGRFMAAVHLNLDVAPVIQIDGLTEAQKKAFVIADNKIAMNSTWDQNSLWNEIRELNVLGFDLNILGFEDMELLPIVDDGSVDDPMGEWVNMPEYIQDDLTAHRTVYVHFRNDEDVAAFFKIMKQNHTEKTKYIWFPELEINVVADKRYE